MKDVTGSALKWLRRTCAQIAVEPVAIFRSAGSSQFPFVAATEAELMDGLRRRGYFVALPREPAALANVIEVSLADQLAKAAAAGGIDVVRGTERSYPDMEFAGGPFGAVPVAVDIKVARRAKSGKATESRITLMTGNTYFRTPSIKWPGALRPFNAYAAHLDVVVLYTFVPTSESRIADVDILAHETWRLASRQRSSTTREYIGAVVDIGSLKAGKGEFETKVDFETYWRKFPFKTGRAVQKMLDKLLSGEPPKLRIKR
ncbi:MAG: hypothetical protein NBV67_19305 [Tagaea sp.]|nr:hypothetical protein [Tagaea sp.]